MTSLVLSTFEGLGYGFASIKLGGDESAVLAGQNSPFAALLQTAEAFNTGCFVEKAVEASGKYSFSWKYFSVVWLTPAVLAILKEWNLFPETCRPLINLIQDHFGALCNLANGVSSVALLAFGQPFFASASLLVLGIGFLDRKKILPVSVRQLLHEYSEPIQIGLGLFTGRAFDFVIGGIMLTIHVANRYLVPKVNCSHNLKEGKLNKEKLEEILDARASLELDKTYVHYTPLPKAPDVDIQVLVERFKSIDWIKQGKTLKLKLQTDQRYLGREGDPSEKTEEELIQFVQKELETCVRAIKEKQIFAGEPLDYDKLHHYWKIIAQHIQDEKTDEVSNIDILSRLAVEGGTYCGVALFEVAESIIPGIIGKQSGISLQDKLCYVLQAERDEWFQFVAHKCIQITCGLLGNPNAPDRHIYNIYLNLYGDHFGLSRVAAQNDPVALVDPLSRFIAAQSCRGRIDTLFWEEHTVEKVTDVVQESIGNSRLPKSDVYKWWDQWVDRQPLEKSEKEKLKEELSLHASLFGRPFEDGRGKIYPHFVRAMLYDLGIFVSSV